MNRGQSGFPVGLLRQISRVFGIINLRKRKITFLDYNSTFRLGGMERVRLSVDYRFTDLRVEGERKGQTGDRTRASLILEGRSNH